MLDSRQLETAPPNEAAPRAAALTSPYGTPPSTVRNTESLSDLDLDIGFTVEITELQEQVMDLNNRFVTALSSLKEQMKKTPSTESIQRFNQTMISDFEKHNRCIHELRKKLNELYLKVQKIQNRREEEALVAGMQRLSQTVDRRLDCLGLYIRISMLANETLSLEIKKMEDMVFPALKEMKAEIGILKAQNAQLRQEVSDLTEKLKENHPQP